jgi:ribosomal protein S18 acetylase RimI-like enzyme
VNQPPGLGPHLVGQRVVVRRLLRGETGPSGGPAMTDLLGVMESWEADATAVRDASGTLTVVPLADIVSGKPVPPRPSVRHRVSAAQAEERAAATWPATESRRLGDWLLRAAGGFSARANAVLAVGSPGVPFGQALSTVTDFYGSHGLPTLVQVVVGSENHHAFESAGWLPARPGEADTCFQIASVARASRAVRGSLPDVVPPVTLEPRVTDAWLADDARAREHGQAARAVLEGPDEVAFAQVAGDVPGSLAARGRGCYHDDWLGISDVHVAPERRRAGLGMAVLGALLQWGAERGATTAFLQVRGDNGSALALYERAGFTTHHEYRYLQPPA